MNLLQDVAEQHVLARRVRDFDANVMRAGNRREDSHARCRERERDIVVEVGEPADAHARRQVHFEQRDRRAGDPVDDLRHDAEILHRLLQAGGGFGKLVFKGLRLALALPHFQKRHIGQLESVVRRCGQSGVLRFPLRLGIGEKLRVSALAI